MFESDSIKIVFERFHEYIDNLTFNPFNPRPMPLPESSGEYDGDSFKIEPIFPHKKENLNNSQKQKKENQNFEDNQLFGKKIDEEPEIKFYVEFGKNEKGDIENYCPDGIPKTLFSTNNTDKKNNNQNNMNNMGGSGVPQNQKANSINEIIIVEKNLSRKSKKQIFKVVTVLKKIEYKKHNVKKKLKHLILKASLKRLEKLISKIFKYLPKHNKKENKIHGANSKNISERVSAKDDDIIWDMKYIKILIYAKNIETKNPQYKNDGNIKIIIDFIDNYKKNDKILEIVKEIKSLLNKRFYELIILFANSEDFEKFKKEDQAIISRNRIKKEKQKLDIFTTEGLLNLFRPSNIKRTVNLENNLEDSDWSIENNNLTKGFNYPLENKDDSYSLT